ATDISSETEETTVATDTSSETEETTAATDTSMEMEETTVETDASNEIDTEAVSETKTKTAKASSTETDAETTDSSDSSENDIALTADDRGDYGPDGEDWGSQTKKYTHLDAQVNGGTISGTITNTSTEVVNVTVTKKWDDSDNTEGIRPDSIDVSLTDSNGNVKGTATLSEGNSWTYTWEELSLDEGTYYVKESSVTGYTLSGGTLEVTTSSSSGSTTSTYSGTVTITGMSTTAYVYSSNGTLKYTVTFNGTPTTSGSQYEYQTSHDLSLELETGDIIRLTVSYDYSYTLNNKTYTGSVSNATLDITVDLEKSNVCPDGSGYDFVISASNLFESTITVETNVNTEITNTINTVDIPVIKKWEDNENEASLRPDSVTVTLYKNGSATEQTLTLSETNGWTDTFENLPEYGLIDGSVAKNIYTVEETTDKNYSAEITGDSSTGYIITNTLKTVDVTVTKIVKGNMGDTTKTFEFTLTDENEKDLTGNNGFSLKSGEEETITGIAIGSSIILTETNYDGYNVSVSCSSGNVTESDGKYTIVLAGSDDITITVTNEKNVTPDTGIDLDTTPYIAILFGVMLFGVAFLNHRRRRLL
ncbi:MAG: Cna B-type domain-containing protein, partial [Clostridiales bacterium]|nr:Cna B-type domain-containing protein [Clostridiales bacterium]